jgi:hypothetical protein
LVLVSCWSGATSSWRAPQHPEAPLTDQLAAKLEACSPKLARANLRRVEQVRDGVYSVQTAQLRYFVFAAETPCLVMAADGDASSIVKGELVPGAGTLIASALQDCASLQHEPDTRQCRAAVALETSEHTLVDVVVVPEDCTNPPTLERIRLTASHESLRLPCIGPSGPDSARTDHILDAGSGRLAVMLTADLGARLWDPELQRDSPEPGSLQLVTNGARTVLRAVLPIYGDKLARFKRDNPDDPGCLPVLESTDWIYDDVRHVLTRAAKSRVHSSC